MQIRPSFSFGGADSTIPLSVAVTPLRRHGAIDKFRFLLYWSGLTKGDLAKIKADDEGVRWLGDPESNAVVNS
jgi:hypothetical protein